MYIVYDSIMVIVNAISGDLGRVSPKTTIKVFVIGANDGVLPASNNTEGLLSEDEKAVLIKGSFEITRSDDLRVLRAADHE